MEGPGKVCFFCSFFKIIVLFYNYYFFNPRFEDCRRFNTSIMCLTFFVIVLNIMVVAFGGPGLDIKPWYQKNDQKSSKKASQKTWYSFRKSLTFFIIVLNIMVIAFGGPAPGLHYTSNFDTISEITFLNYFFIYKIGCTTDIIILRYWIISFSSF